MAKEKGPVILGKKINERHSALRALTRVLIELEYHLFSEKKIEAVVTEACGGNGSATLFL